MIVQETTDMPVQTFRIGVNYGVEGLFVFSSLLQGYDVAVIHRLLDVL